MKTTTYHCAGMCCPTEEQIIRNRLKTMPGVDKLAFNTMQQELTVTHRQDDDQAIPSALNNIGMEASIKGEKAAEHEAEHTGAAPIPRATWIATGFMTRSGGRIQKSPVGTLDSDRGLLFFVFSCVTRTTDSHHTVGKSGSQESGGNPTF